MANLITHVSEAAWCAITNGRAEFQTAHITLDDGRPPGAVSWLDRLFEGGIHLPEGAGRPLSMLLAGPPGSGKSTLAIELCHRMRLREDASKPDEEEPLFSLYISLESESSRLIRNGVNLGYPNFRSQTIVYSGRKPENKVLAVMGREQIDNLLREGQKQQLSSESSPLTEMTELFLEYALKFPDKTLERTKKIARGLGAGIRRRQPPINTKRAGKMLAAATPDVVVIDSLNVLGADDKPQYFDRFLARVPPSTKLVVFVLDSVAGAAGHPTWEFVCDNVIRTSYETHHNYHTRTIEIVKARYQGHALGKHQLKIYSKPAIPREEVDRSDRTDRMLRAHPYRTQGGVFIFPSLHFYLSLYKRHGAAEEGRKNLNEPDSLYVDPGCNGLSAMVRFPKGRCTAFVGVRGGHKSHLAYVHLLTRILANPMEAGLVISLREDEQRSYSTMQRILRDELGGGERIDEFRAANRLEVLYYHPGYITPEEFFHRMFISIQRLKNGGRTLTVMFNSLDQLGAKFPLCARHEGFVASIVEALAGEHATSIFIAVDEPGQPAEQYGLLAMADLILSFNQYEFSHRDYLLHVSGNQAEKHSEQALGAFTATQARRIIREEVVLQVVRYAGGIRAGARGILELVEHSTSHDARKMSVFKKPGLHFSPLNVMAAVPVDSKPHRDRRRRLQGPSTRARSAVQARRAAN
jgi:KaiC/GvpD/RAD55 family RecA-like ATPase